jgi:hypothetical protein
VAILLRVLESRLFLQVMDTDMLTPRWSKTAPDMLLSVTEKYKVGGQALQDAGYRIAAEDIGADFWFQRVWDADSETWYLPWKVADVDAVPAVDADNTLAHRLGFVPIAWVRNLPGGDGVDGACTFPDEAIDTQIEIDYQLSQAGRALKFMGDPTLVIRGEFNAGSDGGIVKGAGNALMLPEDGEASLLQIDGAASAAVLDYVKHLREVALEAMHGNRASNDKTSAAQSGRALELLNQPLIWLADRLRISYGEGAILALLRMVVQASNQIALRFADGSAVGRFDPSLPLSLRWPEWFAPSAQERQCRAATLSLLCGSGLLSRATAIRILCADYDIEDAAAELALADAERGTGGKTGSAAIDRIDPIDPNGQ